MLLQYIHIISLRDGVLRLASLPLFPPNTTIVINTNIYIKIGRLIGIGFIWSSNNRYRLWKIIIGQPLITRKEIYVDILKQHLKPSVRKKKLGRKWVLQKDNDPKHTSKIVVNGLRTTKSRYWSDHHKALTTKLKKICGQNWKSVCKQGGLETWLSYTSSVSKNGPKFTQLIVGSLWKATRNVWPKLNDLKAMLPNTNWVYVNFWPTGNVKKKLKAEINLSLYYSIWHFTFLK